MNLATNLKLAKYISRKIHEYIILCIFLMNLKFVQNKMYVLTNVTERGDREGNRKKHQVFAFTVKVFQPFIVQ